MAVASPRNGSRDGFSWVVMLTDKGMVGRKEARVTSSQWVHGRDLLRWKRQVEEPVCSVCQTEELHFGQL